MGRVLTFTARWRNFLTPLPIIIYVENLIEKTKSRARSVVYWPGLNEDIERMISSCGTCQKFRRSNVKQPLLPHPIPALPYQKLGMDIADFEVTLRIVRPRS